MDKNKLKKIGVFAGAIVLSGTISYSTITNVFNVKPFTQNTYSIYKINLKEYKKSGINDKSYYRKDGKFNKYILGNYIFIKTPYYTDKKGNIIRDVYTYDVSNLSQDDIDFIINNDGNNNLILNQDYMKTINEALTSDYSLLDNIPELHYVWFETTGIMPENNDFEIYYAEYNPDSRETVYYNSANSDNILSFYYVTGNVVCAYVVSKLYDEIVCNRNKKKSIKILNNTKEE